MGNFRFPIATVLIMTAHCLMVHHSWESHFHLVHMMNKFNQVAASLWVWARQLLSQGFLEMLKRCHPRPLDWPQGQAKPWSEEWPQSNQWKDTSVWGWGQGGSGNKMDRSKGSTWLRINGVFAVIVRNRSSGKFNASRSWTERKSRTGGLDAIGAIGAEAN